MLLVIIFIRLCERSEAISISEIARLRTRASAEQAAFIAFTREDVCMFAYTPL